MDFGSLRFLVLTSNEGAQRAGQVNLQTVFEVACRSTGSTWDALDAVIVARQDRHVEGGASDWAAVAAAFGFDKQVVDVSEDGLVRQSLTVFARDEAAFQVADSFHTRPVHDKGKLAKFGVATAVLMHHPSSMRVCLGSAHMDGSVCDVDERMSNVASAVHRAAKRAGPLHAAFVMGDMNCTLEPRTPADVAESVNETRSLLAEEIQRVAGLSEKSAVTTLPEPAMMALQRSLANQGGRVTMQTLDSSPTVLEVTEASLQYDQHASGDHAVESDASGFVRRLELQPMPPGSFPTYRFCGHAYVADGVKPMLPETTLEPAEINEWYFSSEDGKAGAVKKREEMVRLQLGWLDRMYSGLAAEMPDQLITQRIVQGESMAIPVVDSSQALDHLIVPWLVALSPVKSS